MHADCIGNKRAVQLSAILQAYAVIHTYIHTYVTYMTRANGRASVYSTAPERRVAMFRLISIVDARAGNDECSANALCTPLRGKGGWLGTTRLPRRRNAPVIWGILKLIANVRATFLENAMMGRA